MQVLGDPCCLRLQTAGKVVETASPLGKGKAESDPTQKEQEAIVIILGSALWL